MQPPRKKMRWDGYDYSQGGYYFVTICTYNKWHFFGEIVDETMQLNELGRKIDKQLLELLDLPEELLVAYVIMPNHIHLLIKLPEGNNLGNVIRKFKARASRLIRPGMWQRNYYDRVVRDEEEYVNALEYIANNPANWLKDKNYW